MNKHKLILLSLAALAASGVVSCTTVTKDTATMTKQSQSATTPAQALQKLKDGNARFVAGRPSHRDHIRQVHDTAAGQHPFASVVSCIDSRTGTELIFDQGIGDVFTARVAGNIVNRDIIGSLEFASKVAGSKVIAVIGHTKCGAVKGACDHVKLGNLTGLLEKIEPAVDSTPSAKGEDRSSKNGAFVDRVAEQNVRRTIAAIRSQSHVLRDMEKRGEINITGGMYDVATGRAAFFE
ncbi:MAG: carbonic anhydrase [Verrucomicrobiaceae bacterium]|nr:carbonic anhydrase [Verrucomicrobiaceae bacterium]